MNLQQTAFPTYSKSTGDDFDHVYLKAWKISIIVGIITEKRWKHCGTVINGLFSAISPFVKMFAKATFDESAANGPL